MTVGVKPDGSPAEAAAAQMAITKLFGSSMLLKLSKKPETCVVEATSTSLTSTPWSFACDAVPITTVPAGQNASDSVLSAKPEPPFAGASRTVPFTSITAVPPGQNAAHSGPSPEPGTPIARAASTVPLTYVTAPMALATFAVRAVV